MFTNLPIVKYFLFTLLALLIAGQVEAQSNLNLKFFGLSLHPKGDVNAPLMPLNPDKKGYFVFNLGGTLGYEHFLKPDKFSLKAIQAVYSDCAAQLGGFTHLGVRWVIFKKGKHSLNGGFGPTLVYRRNWYELDNYEDSGFFKGGQDVKYQYKFIPYAGEFEYNLALNEQYEFSTTFIPGFPSLMSLSFGIRYWLPQKKKTEAPLPVQPAVRR
ncbi:hypothetical protein [Adhaeribacter rhizoryzae]|uniref:hypothetical protein n=1 Tax=Adhaeribacter rhizoryzae TaxID=2607907 RepID=UPI001CC1ED0C|nr:hypothetical protein [Adhaeribacter rhizoryzae]